MRLYLIRHGETDWNRDRRFQSTSDIPLNDTGRSQAERIRERFKLEEVGFAEGISSPLVRAVETARIVLNDTGTALSVDPRLTEIALGEYEGRKEAELREELGTAFSAWRDACFTVPAPGGESILDAMRRALAALARFENDAGDENLLIVGHQGINMAIMAAISGRTDRQSLMSFKQRNDQVEVWDLGSKHRLEGFLV